MTRRALIISIAALLITAGVDHAAFTTIPHLATKRTAGANL
jgi:hypothetical protein